MSKSTMFFSHSTGDKAALCRLKDLFVEKTGGTIEVFLSSDGQSIPLGKNWVHAVEEGLERASLMLVFITPRSLRSHWLYFEAGYVYGKRVRVVPVGFKGVDLAKVPPPLSLLQGFNITSSESLDNIVALANECFEHSHTAKFTADEYQEILSLGEPLEEVALGSPGELVKTIAVFEKDGGHILAKKVDAITVVAEILDRKGMRYQRDKKSIWFAGVSLRYADDTVRRPLEIEVDPHLFHVSAPILCDILAEIREGGAKGSVLSIVFYAGVLAISEKHKIAARLHGSRAGVGDTEEFVCGDLSFGIAREGGTYEPVHIYGPVGYSNTAHAVGAIVSITVCGNAICVADVRGLLELLFDKHVVWHVETSTK